MSALSRRLRKIHRKLISDSKGFSSIVGAVFAALVMISLISTVFVWSLSQNTLYNNTVTQTRQADLDRSNEKTAVLNTTYTLYNNSKVNVYAQIQNIGSSSIQFITVWLYMSNSTPWTSYNFSSLVNANVQSGSTFTLNVNLTVTGVKSNSTYSISSWLITARGNTVGLQQTIVSSNTIINSSVTQGIGAISFNFEQFWHYDFSSAPAQGTTLPSKNSLNYTVSEGNYTVFHVNLTDYDPLQNNIVVNGNSSIYIIGQHSGTVKYATWNLVNVTNNKIYPSSTAKYSLVYGVPTELYFSGSISAIDTPNPYPLNILLMGTKGNNEYGQNIPFVSIYLVS